MTATPPVIQHIHAGPLPCRCGPELDVLYMARQQKERWPMTATPGVQEARAAVIEAYREGETQAVFEQLLDDLALAVHVQACSAATGFPDLDKVRSCGLGGWLCDTADALKLRKD